MKRTSARLADGREIIYFDTDDDAFRKVPDTRALTERAQECGRLARSERHPQ